MYLIQWHIVDGGFGFAEELEGAECEVASLRRQWRRLQNGANGGQVAAVAMDRIQRGFMVVRMRMIVMMMVVIMRVGMIARRVGFVAVDPHMSFARADAAAVYRIEGEGCAEIERGSGLLKKFRRDAGVDQGAEEHVTAEAGEAFEIANAHDDPCRISEGRCSDDAHLRTRPGEERYAASGKRRTSFMEPER